MEQKQEIGRAIPFVLFSNKRFIITEEAKEVLSSDYKNVGIISLVGKYRTGKSFLLNRVLLNQKRESGFGVGPTIRPCTKGIWMWSNPIFVENNHCKEKFPVFMIDTEGLGAYDEEINHDSKIFLIAILISSLFLYNSFGSIDENAINSLSFILNLSKTIKLRESSSGNNSETQELASYFPSLLWLLRDFSLKLEDSEGNTITARQYLENALQPFKGSSEIVEEKNKLRKMITTYFGERDCFSLVRPVENETDLQNLQSLDDSKMRSEFLEQAEMLRNKISKKVKPKLFLGKFLTGRMLLELLNSILDSINQGSIPVIENSWKYVMHNESVKNMNDALKKYINSINKFKEENKDNPSFFSDLESYQKNLEKSLIEEFQKTTVMDEGSVNEFVDKLRTKLGEETKKFNDENNKFFENKMLESLEKNSKKLCDTFETDKYSKNYYQFFQDLENLKEITEASTPDFPMRKEIIFEKMILIIKKFIETTFLKNKLLNEKEITDLKNELQSMTNKHNLKNDELESTKQELTQVIQKLNNQIVEQKLKEKASEDKIRATEEEKMTVQNNMEKKMNELKKEMEAKIEKLGVESKKTENDLKSKEDQIMMMKFTEEKMSALTNQKIEFLEKEMNSHKDRYDQVKAENAEYRKTIEEMNGKMDELKSENNKKKILEYELERLKKEKENNNNNPNYFNNGSFYPGNFLNNPMNMDNLNTMNLMGSIGDKMSLNNPNSPDFNNLEVGIMPESGAFINQTPKKPPMNFKSTLQSPYYLQSQQNETNNELIALLKSQLESSKNQLEETKKMYEEIITTFKSSLDKSISNNVNDKEYKELLESNKSLSTTLSNYENRCSNLEDKIKKLKEIKNLLKSTSALQCKFCAKFFTYDIFKIHSLNCQKDILRNSINNFNKKPVPDKIKIKILKGILNKDELGKPFIEYIVEIFYNTQNWRVNKKFNQFANLHKTLKALFTDIHFPESSNIFSKININGGKEPNNFHENKIKHLEKYLKDISDIGIVNKSKPFRKFFDFEDYMDEEFKNDTSSGPNIINSFPPSNDDSNNFRNEKDELNTSDELSVENFEINAVSGKKGVLNQVDKLEDKERSLEKEEGLNKDKSLEIIKPNYNKKNSVDFSSINSLSNKTNANSNKEQNIEKKNNVIISKIPPKAKPTTNSSLVMNKEKEAPTNMNNRYNQSNSQLNINIDKYDKNNSKSKSINKKTSFS